MLVLLMIFALFTGMSVQGATYVWSNGATDDNTWDADNNWEWHDGSTAKVPDGSDAIHISIGDNETDKAILESFQPSQAAVNVGSSDYGTGPGRLEIKSGADGESTNYDVGLADYSATVNHTGGTYTVTDRFTVGRYDTGTNINTYNLSGGTLDIAAGGSYSAVIARVADDTNTSAESYLNISGDATFASARKVNVGNLGTFSVEGSSTTVNLKDTDIAYESQPGGTLKALIDSGGFNTINLDGDARFRGGSLLDVGFLDEPNYGTFDLMSWGDNNLDNWGDGLAFSGDVDTDVWSFDFVDTDGSGNLDTLQVTSIPEPSSLFLLGLAGLLLLKRRRV